MDAQINLDGSIFHKPCAKCQDCQCQITISNFCKNETSDETVLLCKTHYFKRFHEGGSYLGAEKFQKKQTREMNSEEKTKAGQSAAPVATTAPALAPAPAPASVPTAAAHAQVDDGGSVDDTAAVTEKVEGVSLAETATDDDYPATDDAASAAVASEDTTPVATKEDSSTTPPPSEEA